MAATAGMDSDFYCVRTEGVPQYGLGSREFGHKAGIPSLAAHAASNKGGSWIGAFTVRDGFYLLAVKDDAVLSEYDKFFASERSEEHTSELQSLMRISYAVFCLKKKKIEATKNA